MIASFWSNGYVEVPAIGMYCQGIQFCHVFQLCVINYIYSVFFFFPEISLYRFLNAEDFHTHPSVILCIQNIGLGELEEEN